MIDSEGTDSPPSAYHSLRRRQQKFVDVYVETGNASEAIRRINPKSKRPDIAGSKLKRKPEIRAAIEERTQEDIEEAGVRRNLLLKGLLRIAYFDQRKLYDPNGDLLQPDKLPPEIALALGGIKVLDTKRGPVREYVQESRLQAFTQLLRYTERKDPDSSSENGLDDIPVGKIIVEVVGARTAHQDDPATG